MPITAEDLTAAANAAGIDTPEKAQLAFAIVKSFIDAGISSPAVAAAFATRSALQMAAVAIQAKIVNAGKSRDEAVGVANTNIGTLQAELNAINTQLQQAVAGA